MFVDSDEHSWNMDPELFVEALEERAKAGRVPKAVVLVHLYGQSADIDPIQEACERHGVILIEDAAEALGATYKGRTPGTFGQLGIYSFNGNKIITTSGGGMLVSDDEAFIVHAKKLATQAREPVVHYEHTEIGYNYRLSNVLAGIGRAQLQVLEERVAARRRNFDYYKSALGGLPGISFMPECDWGRHTRWLTTLTIDPETFGADREEVRLALEAANIESRPVWRPMHFSPSPPWSSWRASRSWREIGRGVRYIFPPKKLCGLRQELANLYRRFSANKHSGFRWSRHRMAGGMYNLGFGLQLVSSCGHRITAKKS